MNSDVWKTLTVGLAAFVTGILIAGIPFVLRAATTEQIERIEDRQLMMLERQAAMNAQLEFAKDQVETLVSKVDTLERLLRDSSFGTSPP